MTLERIKELCGTMPETVAEIAYNQKAAKRG